MENTAVDTNIVIAGLLEWHEHHARALAVLLAAQGATSGMILPLPVLLESYSVLTRLPAPYRLSARTAHDLLRLALSDKSHVVGAATTEAWPELKSAAAQGTSGGSIYDAHILTCAKAAGARRFVTFNSKDFLRLDLGQIELVEP